MSSSAHQPIDTSVRPRALPPAQREGWLASVMDERVSRSFNSTFLIHLSGSLNEAALQSSLQAWLDRHDALRAQFDLKSPTQILLTHVRLPWRRVDLSAVEPNQRNNKLTQLATEQSQVAFDLSLAPLLRMTLVVWGPESHVLVGTISQLVADAESLRVLLSELKPLYAARLDGVAWSVDPAPSFDVYAALTETPEFLESTTRSKAYWKQIYAELPGPLELPADRIRRTPRTFGAGRVSATWDASSVRSLREMGERCGATLKLLLLGGFQILLHRLTGQDDLVLCLPVAGRNSPSFRESSRIRSLVGHCTQLLPTRHRWNASLPFQTHLETSRAVLQSALEHQDVPFGELLECLDVPRDAERMPLASVVFDMEEATGDLGLSGLHTRVDSIPSSTQLFDLSLKVVEDEKTLTLHCDFNPDLFERSTILRWLRHLHALLESAVSTPLQPVGSLEMLTAEERRLMLLEWNATLTPLPQALSVHALFSEQARKSPHAIAVQHGDRQLTYAELDRCTDALAARLQSLGVGVDSLVGIYLNRSPLLVVATLGVMKAGAAYVPLDPAFPRERLGWMVEDARLQVIVTESSLLSDLPPHKAQCVCLDKEPLSQGSPVAAAKPGSLAYVIFTSGSTGRPKGVEVLHRGVVNFLNSMRKAPGIRPQDVLLSVTTLSFDIAGLELFLPLISGARVVIATREMMANGEQLAAEITLRGVTFLQATPTTWRLLLAAGWKGSPGLKILCGGEAFPPDLAAQLLPICGAVWNMYGPTETTIWSTCCQLSSSDPTLTIGRPIDNTSLYIVDKRLQPMPIGVPGELLIGGAGVARGYLERPELTAEKFIRNPFRSTEESRLYRTGDLARWTEDGQVVCLGRVDHQVKLRGYRIELGDIETAISRQSGVGACAVIVREDQPGDKRLVAYLESSSTHPIDLAQVRSMIRQVLPDYMHPQHWVMLPRLPLTPNAKIDRRALPAPAIDTTSHPTDYEKPVSETEQRLAKLWAQILKVDKVSRRSNFFDLGGHSILAVRLFSEIETTFGCQLPLATLLRAETLQALASQIDGGKDPALLWTSLVPIRTAGSRPPFFCAHGGGGEVLFARDIMRCLPEDQPFYGLQARGLQGDHARDTSVEIMSQHYVKELLEVQTSGPFYLGGFCMGGVIAFDMARQLIASGHSVALVVMIGTYNPTEARRSGQSVSSLEVWRQKLAFHWENWSALPARERAIYLSQRFKAMAAGRLKRLSARVSQMTRKRGPTSNRGMHGLLEDYNDELGSDYEPEPLNVDVFIVRSQKNFTFLSDPQMGWRGCVRGQLEIESVDANPGGLLVEPYVSQVGKAIASALLKAQSAHTPPG